MPGFHPSSASRQLAPGDAILSLGHRLLLSCQLRTPRLQLPFLPQGYQFPQMDCSLHYATALFFLLPERKSLWDLLFPLLLLRFSQQNSSKRTIYTSILVSPAHFNVTKPVLAQSSIGLCIRSRAGAIIRGAPLSLPGIASSLDPAAQHFSLVLGHSPRSQAVCVPLGGCSMGTSYLDPSLSSGLRCLSSSLLAALSLWSPLVSQIPLAQGSCSVARAIHWLLPASQSTASAWTVARGSQQCPSPTLNVGARGAFYNARGTYSFSC